jgi:hypothetical protein
LRLVRYREVATGCLSPGKFYKGRSQEKTHLLRLDFFLASQPT